MGTNVEQATKMIEDAISNLKTIENITPLGRTDQVMYKIEGQINQKFKIHIKNNITHFYPFVD